MSVSEVLNKLFEWAPQIGWTILFLIIVFGAWREFRKFRGEIGTEVNDAVNARLGSLIGDIQIKLVQASETLQKIEAAESKVERQASNFQSHMTQRQEEIEKIFSAVEDKLHDVESKLQVLEAETPRAGAISARDRVTKATYAKTVNEALSEIERVKSDPEATPADIEKAGSIAKQRGKKKLALELYAKASELDPEFVTAKLEHLRMRAETDHSQREESLREAEELVLSQEVNDDLTPELLGKLDNTLIELRRYDAVAELCRSILGKNPHPGSNIDVQARRDLAVTLQQRGELAEAVKELEKIVAVAPDDENVLKLYFGLLLANGENDKALSIAKNLLRLDPLDPLYYRLVASAYEALAKYEAAIEWMSRAEPLLEEGDVEKLRIERWKTRLLLRRSISDVV